MFPLLKKIPPEPRRDFCSGFFDAINFKPADQVLHRQLLGQELLVGSAPVLPGARSFSISDSTLSRSFSKSAYMRS